MFDSVRVSASQNPEVLVVGVFQPEKGSPALDAQTKSRDVGGMIAGAVKRAECTGAAGTIAEAFIKKGKSAQRILVVGLGKKASIERGDNIAGAVGRRLASIKAKSAEVDFRGPLKEAKVDSETFGGAFGEGMGLIAFNVDEYRGAATTKTDRVKLAINSPDKSFAKRMKRGLALAESINFARMCANTPPNIATPEWMATQAKTMARGDETVSVRIIKGEALKKEKMIGHVIVGQASENPPCLIRIAYTPAGAAGKKKPAVFVGKTVTYDTGGLSLKPPAGMRGMKSDKDGGCAVLGAMHAIAKVIKPKQPVVGLLVAAENSVSDDAYRPDDVMTFRNGVTVEVTNTDAEGRLVLADGLCWAKDKEKPAFIVDIATLTGGVITALGSTFAGMWCDDDALRGRVEASAARCDERVWRLPLHQEYRDLMKSPIADIVNSSATRKAHPIQGAAFLSYFVDDSMPWCHLDIAGVHRVESDTGPFAKDTPTGFGVRLLAGLFE